MKRIALLFSLIRVFATGVSSAMYHGRLAAATWYTPVAIVVSVSKK